MKRKRALHTPFLQTHQQTHSPRRWYFYPFILRLTDSFLAQARVTTAAISSSTSAFSVDQSHAGTPPILSTATSKTSPFAAASTVPSTVDVTVHHRYSKDLFWGIRPAQLATTTPVTQPLSASSLSSSLLPLPCIPPAANDFLLLVDSMTDPQNSPFTIEVQCNVTSDDNGIVVDRSHLFKSISFQPAEIWKVPKYPNLKQSCLILALRTRLLGANPQQVHVVTRSVHVVIRCML